MVPRFSISFPKLGHELHCAASNYQPCERIEGEELSHRC